MTDSHDPRVRLSDRAAAMLEPVQSVVAGAIAALPAGPAVAVDVGDVPSFYAVAGSRLTLSAALEGPAVHHPGERSEVYAPLDRWRRAAASLLEGVALVAFEAASGAPSHEEWWAVGAVVDAADRAAPDLAVADPDVATAIAVADLQAHPRSGVAVMRYWRDRGDDPWVRALSAVQLGGPDPEEWVAVGDWVLGARGALAQLRSPVRRRAHVDIPYRASPWSWVPLSVPAHPRGGRVVVRGAGAVLQPWAEANCPLRTTAGAASGSASFEPESGGPTGKWQAATAEGYGQVYGIRGIQFVFRPSGLLELVMADAFAGPVAAVEMAERVGTSGTATGRWAVAGPFALRFASIATHGLTMHGRDDEPFVVPAGGMGLGAVLTGLQDGVWTWAVTGDRLMLTGTMMGGPVQIHLRRAA